MLLQALQARNDGLDELPGVDEKPTRRREVGKKLRLVEY